MALTASEIFDAVAPELAASARKTTFLTLAEGRMAGRTVWLTLYEQAQAYLAAHLLTLSPEDSGAGADAGGPISSKTAGDLSVTYAVAQSESSSWEGSLGLTRYGREFLALMRLVVGGTARVVPVRTR